MVYSFLDTRCGGCVRGVDLDRDERADTQCHCGAAYRRTPPAFDEGANARPLPCRVVVCRRGLLVACACRISGELRSQLAAADVIGPTGPGVTAGEFDELIDAFGAGVTYVNVHTSKYPGWEIRAQLVNGNH